MGLILIFVAGACGGLAYYFAKEERRYALCAGLLGPIGWILFRFRKKQKIRLLLNALILANGLFLAFILGALVIMPLYR